MKLSRNLTCKWLSIVEAGGCLGSRSYMMKLLTYYWCAVFSIISLQQSHGFIPIRLSCSNFGLEAKFHPSKIAINTRNHNIAVNSLTNMCAVAVSQDTTVPRGKLSKLTKRWITGLSLGTLATLWIASGQLIFASIFFFISLTTQNEYFSMVKAAGILPAYKTGNLTCLMCYFTAACSPIFHELVMPLYATYLMLYLLIFSEKSAKISEIATSLLGVFYLGYLPSFWIRLRSADLLFQKKAYVWSSLKNIYESIGGDAVWTLGSASVWFTWTAIVFSDVGAYFIGKNFGRHKLSIVSKAAGAASPNKTIEGAVGGFACCTVISTIGAFIMNWPLWMLSGPLYGLIMGVVGLIGDLTASMLKRDAGFKDSGDVLPGHGGLLDRCDSYLLTAPIAFLYIKYILPLLQRII